MRVTENTTSNRSLNNLQLIRQRLEELQQQASTNTKISRPGDDPIAAQQVLDLKGLVAENEQYARNISTGNGWLSQAESALGGMGDRIARVKEIALQMSNGTYSATQRENIAKEVAEIKNDLIALGSTQIAGKYIFGGFKNDTPPFDTLGNFVGDDSDVLMPIDRTNTIVINISGGNVLRGGTPPGSTGVDILGTLDTLVTDLQNDNAAGISASISSLDGGYDQLLTARTVIGGRMNRLETTTSLNEQMQLDLKKSISDKQDVDFLKVVSDLNLQQTAFEAALKATANASKISLVDYL